MQIFKEIGTIEPLKCLASGTNKLAAKFASQALRLIGEEVPHKLSPQVPLWTPEDISHWLHRVSSCDYIDLSNQEPDNFVAFLRTAFILWL